MEQILENGDWAVGANGLPRMARGHDAQIERARVRLRVPRGALPLEPELGSRLSALGGKTEADGSLDLLALQYAREALLDETGVRVLGARVEGNPPARAVITLLTPVRAQEVTVSL